MKSKHKHKFYFAEFTHIETGKVFHKFGITSKKDALDRFSLFFENNAKYAEFSIRVLFSYYNNNSVLIKNIENLMTTMFPKNFVLENYLDKPHGYYNGLSGITETVVISPNQVNEILRSLYKFKANN